MSFQTVLLQVLLCGMIARIQSALVNSTSGNTNVTKSSARSGRKFNDQQQFVSIPVGYYNPDQQSTNRESENGQNPNYNVPTSFEDFMPSGKMPRNNYPAYYTGKGDSLKGAPPPQVSNWKGDYGSDDSAATWIPSPTDMMMVMNMMKDMNGDNSVDAVDVQPTGLLSKLTAEPLAVFLAIVIPFTVLLAAVLPMLTSFITSGDGMNIPTVTTVATGNTGRKLSESTSFVTPILEAIESFSGRSSAQPACLQKTFCEATRGANGTEFRPIQRSIYKAFTFVDDYWLETLGMKQLMEAMGTGNCEKIQCDVSQSKENNFKDKHSKE